jgi:hypothetical protein
MNLESIDKAFAMVRIDYEFRLICIRHVRWQLPIAVLRVLLLFLCPPPADAVDYCRDCNVPEGMWW